MTTASEVAHGDEDKVSTGQAAHLLGVDRSTVFRLIQRGDIPAEETTFGDRTFHRIAMEDLKEFQRKREAKILDAPINHRDESPSPAEPTPQRQHLPRSQAPGPKAVA